jgi:hypothetical protein
VVDQLGLLFAVNIALSHKGEEPVRNPDFLVQFLPIHSYLLVGAFAPPLVSRLDPSAAPVGISKEIVAIGIVVVLLLKGFATCLVLVGIVVEAVLGSLVLSVALTEVDHVSAVTASGNEF